MSKETTKAKIDLEIRDAIAINSVTNVVVSNILNEVVDLINTQDLQSVIDNSPSTAILTNSFKIDGDIDQNFTFEIGANVRPVSFVSILGGSGYSNFGDLTLTSTRSILRYFNGGNYSAGLELRALGSKLFGGTNGGNGHTVLFMGANTANSTFFTDSRTSTFQTGLEYSADYSANYTPRSFVDKAYVDNKVSTVDISGKVDKVEGERLINASEITKLGNQSGTNTGDQDLQSVFNAGNTYATITANGKTAELYYSPQLLQLALQSVTDSQNSTFSAFYADAISPTMQLQEQKNGVMSSSYFKFSAQETDGIKTFFIPSKPIGDYTLATLDDIPTPKYRVFTGLISQEGTAPPVVVVLQDDFNVGFNVVRFKVGGYLLEFLQDIFIGGDLKFHSSIGTENYYNAYIGRNSNYGLIIQSYNPSNVNADDLLYQTSFEFKVYPTNGEYLY